MYCCSVISCSHYEEPKYSSFTVLYLNYLKIGLDQCCARPFNSNNTRLIKYNRKYLLLPYSHKLHFIPPDGISVNLSCQ